MMIIHIDECHLIAESQVKLANGTTGSAAFFRFAICNSKLCICQSGHELFSPHKHTMNTKIVMYLENDGKIRFIPISLDENMILPRDEFISLIFFDEDANIEEVFNDCFENIGAEPIKGNDCEWINAVRYKIRTAQEYTACMVN